MALAITQRQPAPALNHHAKKHKRTTARPYIGFVAIGERHDKIMCIRTLGSSNDFLKGRVRLSVPDVLFNGCIKQERFLTDDSNTAPEIADVDVFEVSAVQENTTISWIVEPLDKLCNCRLPAPTFPDLTTIKTLKRK